MGKGQRRHSWACVAAPMLTSRPYFCSTTTYELVDLVIKRPHFRFTERAPRYRPSPGLPASAHASALEHSAADDWCDCGCDRHRPVLDMDPGGTPGRTMAARLQTWSPLNTQRGSAWCGSGLCRQFHGLDADRCAGVGHYRRHHVCVRTLSLACRWCVRPFAHHDS